MMNDLWDFIVECFDIAFEMFSVTLEFLFTLTIYCLLIGGFTLLVIWLGGLILG